MEGERGHRVGRQKLGLLRRLWRREGPASLPPAPPLKGEAQSSARVGRGGRSEGSATP